MKTSYLLIAVGLAFSSYLLGAQPATHPGAPVVVGRDAHSKTWQWDQDVTWPDGQIVRTPHRYVELATGMHYKDEQGQWQESRELIEAFPGGAIARYGQIQVIFAPNLNTFGAIDTKAPDGTRVQSHVLGLAFYDLAAEQSVMIAQVKDCVGAVLAPNQVVYQDGFDGNVSADIIYTYRRGSFHQDLVLRAQLPVTPEDYGLDSASTVLEVWTEMISATEPVRVSQSAIATLQSRANPGGSALVLTDEDLDFGATRLIAGRAFGLGSGASSDPFSNDGLRVAKSWVVADGGRRCLVEAVPYVPLRDRLTAELPRANAAPAIERAALRTGRRLPAAPVQARVDMPSSPMQMASLPTRPGFVLDYEKVVTTSDMTFHGDTTYMVLGTVNLSGTTTFEGGTVIKHTNGLNSVYLNIVSGTIDCKTTPWLPATLTSYNDNSIGQTLPGSTGTPTMLQGATRIRTVGTNTVHDLRYRYAEYGHVCTPSTGRMGFTNVQFFQCRYPLYLSGGQYDVHNLLLTDCEHAVYNTSTTNGIVSIEHGTFDRVNKLVGGILITLKLTNSLLVAVSNNVHYTGETNIVLTNGTGVFQTVGVGEHYLAANSPYRDLGTTNISAGIQADLRILTTYPPLLLTNSITADTVLSPQAGRDTDSPDVGFHYAPIDFLVSALTVASNATVLATNGVVLGVDYFVTNSWGFILAPGKFISQGRPELMNRVVRAHNVQEKSNANPGTRALFYDGSTPSGSTNTLLARFTEFAQLAEDGYLLYTGTKFDALEWTHSAVYNPSLVIDTSGSGTMTVGATNTLWDRGAVLFGLTSTSAGKVVHCRNNLWRGVSLHFIDGNTNWTVADELFDRMYYLGDHSSPVLNYTNAWYLTNYGLSGGLGIIELTNLTYEIGPLGRYYQPTNSPQIINQGSHTADLAGLYHFTTTTNQVKEGSGTVDIGIHYVAVTNIAGVWLPIDTDGDGAPDYFEDANGNGVWNDGESDWQSSGNRTNDFNGSLNLQVYTPLR